MTLTDTKIITLERLERMKPCAEQYATVARMYPDGVPLTAAAIAALEPAGVDTMWAGLRLLTARQRREFVVFTLRQRQPALVTLFGRAGLPEQAAAIEALRLREFGDMPVAQEVFAAARDAARDAARGAARVAAWDAAWAESAASSVSARAASAAVSAAASAASAAVSAAARAARAAAWDAVAVSATARAARAAAWDAVAAATAEQRAWLLDALRGARP